jgi:lipid A 4'-phosphatase
LGFWLMPELDLVIARKLFEARPGLIAAHGPLVGFFYELVPTVLRIGFVLALIALIAHRLRWLRIAQSIRRSLAAWLTVVVLGLGLVVHVGLKDQWGRPRPNQTVELGGSQPYTPPFQPSARCDRNCSFVSGHAAGGFSLMAFGAVGGFVARRRWLLIGGAVGLATGWIRMIQGGHFLSDILFAGLVIWWCTTLTRIAFARWLRGQSSSSLGHSSDPARSRISD